MCENVSQFIFRVPTSGSANQSTGHRLTLSLLLSYCCPYQTSGAQLYSIDIDLHINYMDIIGQLLKIMPYLPYQITIT